jgi:hypothetical protein
LAKEGSNVSLYVLTFRGLVEPMKEKTLELRAVRAFLPKWLRAMRFTGLELVGLRIGKDEHIAFPVELAHFNPEPRELAELPEVRVDQAIEVRVRNATASPELLELSLSGERL